MPDQKTTLADFFRAISEEKKKTENPLFEELQQASTELPPDPPDTRSNSMSMYLSALRKPSIFDTPLNESLSINEEDYLDRVDPNKQYVTQEDLTKHYRTFIDRVQKQLSTVGGGGEKQFRYLDDVNRSTMVFDNDNFLLEYDAGTGKVQFTDKVGPIEQLSFNTSHIHQEERVPGTLCWDPDDQTLNLTHPGNVTQQIGQELYGYVRNETGSLIPNGTVVRFDGAANENGNARLLMTPFTANGEYPSLYTLGITTSDIANDTNGRVTVWGKVRDIDASGSSATPSETWIVGDILYAHPTDAGNLTKVKPTSPNNVIPIAAVLNNDSSTGEMFVRPTIEQRYDYATVSSTETQNIDLGINTPHEITLNVIADNRGITIDSVDSSRVVFAQSGLYAIGLNVQILSSNSAKKEVFFWIRENGIDVPFSTRTITIVGNNVYTNFGVSYNVSAQAGDYLQFMWASIDVAVVLESGPISAFAPTSPSVYIHIDQAAL